MYKHNDLLLGVTLVGVCISIWITMSFIEIIRTRIEHERQILIREQDQDREAYQKLLSEKNMLESRLEALEKEGNKTGNLDSFSSHNRSLSDASTVSVCDPESSASNMSDHSEEVCLLISLLLRLSHFIHGGISASLMQLKKKSFPSQNFILVPGLCYKAQSK